MSGSGAAAQMALYITRQTLFVLYHGHVIALISPALPRCKPSAETERTCLLIKYQGHDG